MFDMTKAGFLIGLILVAIYLPECWVFMLGIGMVHAQWLTGMPTIDWWSTVAILWFLNLFIFAGSTAASNGSKS